MPQRYHRVLAIVDLGRGSRQVATQAWQLAQHDGARFALGHVADWGQSLGCDDFTLLAPGEVERRLAPIVTRKLDVLAASVGAARAETLVAFPGPNRGEADLARNWQPDIVVTGRHGEQRADRFEVAGWACDLATVETRALYGWNRPLKKLLGGVFQPSLPPIR